MVEMSDGSVSHTSAAEQEAFLSKSSTAQLLDIWLAARETNGAIAEAKRDIASQGRDIQNLGIAFTRHLDGGDEESGIPHLSPKEVMDLRETGSIGKEVLNARLTMWNKVEDMHRWFLWARMSGIIIASLIALLVLARAVWDFGQLIN